MIKKLSIPLRPHSPFKSNKKTTTHPRKDRVAVDSERIKVSTKNNQNEHSWLQNPESKSRALYTLTGIVKRHPDGFGFLIPEDSTHSDVYLSQRQMQYLMNNDKVKIAVFPRKHRKGLFSGKRLKIIHRGQDDIIGQYFPLSNKKGLIRDESYQWGEDLKIQLKENQKIKTGEWVQAKILHWPDSPQGFKGEIICSLGIFPKALEDNIRVVQKHNIPAVFPTNCQKEAEALSVHLPKDILYQRKDLRPLAFITIDGKTAQDFDDAIYVSSHSKGWTLYVAIADVSYYVKKNSALDKEAKRRGNSTYFPGFTLPMLPEKLSNDLCSLKPHEDRLAFVTEIHFDFKTKKEKTAFYPAVIQSRARLNYGLAQTIIENSNLLPETKLEKNRESKEHSEKDISSLNESVLENVRSAGQLAHQLLKQRSTNHFINLDIPETEISLNSLGEPLDISQRRRLFSYQLIEELMLAANKAVAEYLQKHKIPSLYRIHAPPKPESLKFMKSFVQSLGIKIKLSEPDLQKQMSSLIQQFSDHPLSEVIQTLILRSLSQAVYSANNKGHFGLNARHYTHFTSPIRRYSDLVVHRILKEVLEKQESFYKKQDLESIAEISSACEQRSVKAERQIKDIKRARFIKKYLGKEMEGIISGCTRFGFFVKLRLYDIEGLVHINSLEGRWEFEESLLELKSESSGQHFKMGDPVTIQVMVSNIDTGQIDFELKAYKGKQISKKSRRIKPKKKGRTRRTLAGKSHSTPNRKGKIYERKTKKRTSSRKKQQPSLYQKGKNRQK